jgi:hypothetical protein
MASPAKAGTKPMCKYGAKCYRKNEQHIKQYRHPDDDDEEVCSIILHPDLWLDR